MSDMPIYSLDDLKRERQMKILFKYATRGRPELFKKTLRRWIERASGRMNRDCLFAITIDDDDPTMQTPDIIAYMKKMDGKNGCKVGYDSAIHNGKVDAINAHVENYKFDILVVVSDDMLPGAIGYDDIIVRDMRRLFPKLDGALHYPDGLRTDLITCSIMGRRLYDHFGYIYHPAYKALWCDNEFTDMVKTLGKYEYINRSIITHHWKSDDGKIYSDKLTERDEKLFKVDEAVYIARKRDGFPDVMKEVA